MELLVNQIVSHLENHSLDFRMLSRRIAELVSIEVTLRGSRKLKTLLRLDSAARTLSWRAQLLGPKQRSPFWFWLFHDGERAMGLMDLSLALPIARLTVDREEGPVLEVVTPLPETVSEEAFLFIRQQMLWSFPLKRVLQDAMDGGELELSLQDIPASVPPSHRPEKAPARIQAEAEGRLALIDAAICAGDIPTVLKLCLQVDDDSVPTFI